MNKLTLVEQREVLGKEFKIYGNFDDPLFLAKDVAEWIEHSNPSKMVNDADLEESEVVKQRIGTLTNSYDALFLTEDGLYEVLMQSRKPIAKQFKKQVKAILKEIRKTGRYHVDKIAGEQVFLGKMKIEMHKLRAKEFEARAKEFKARAEEEKTKAHRTDAFLGTIETFKEILSSKQFFDLINHAICAVEEEELLPIEAKNVYLIGDIAKEAGVPSLLVKDFFKNLDLKNDKYWNQNENGIFTFTEIGKSIAIDTFEFIKSMSQEPIENY